MNLDGSATLKSPGTDDDREWESTLRHVAGANPIVRKETNEETKSKIEDFNKVISLKTLRLKS